MRESHARILAHAITAIAKAIVIAAIIRSQKDDVNAHDNEIPRFLKLLE